MAGLEAEILSLSARAATGLRHVQAFNQRTGKSVRCYVPTHSLINYAHWCIVSPESSLAKLDGCDGYIAQVWTGTARTPNHFRGVRKERTFETAFLEYGAMQNLVRATGRLRLVPQRSDRRQSAPRLDGLSHQLGIHAGRRRCSSRMSGVTKWRRGLSESSAGDIRGMLRGVSANPSRRNTPLSCRW